jgi:hypothetical protein
MSSKGFLFPVYAFVSAVIALLASSKAAGIVFHRVFSGYNNHDSAAPLLIAALAALAGFLIVLLAVSAVCALGFRLLRKLV